MFAYLDPGTGSLALQGLIASLLAGLFLLKAYWRRLWGSWRNPQPRRQQD